MNGFRNSKSHIWSFTLLFVALFFSGCMHVSDSNPPGPWHESYQPIEDPDSHAFIFQALEKAKVEFGEPVIPVNKVLLRRSRKIEAAQHYRIGEDFSLTECVDSTNGLFVIYVGVDPGHRNYYALLAHECTHLLNPRITDWYMEGIATLFSEQVCAEQGKEWGGWKRHFMRSRRAPYALSYRMMLDLQGAFPVEYSSLMRHTAPLEADSNWQRIEIDSWIETLPQERQRDALLIIEPYVKTLRKNVSSQYGFTVPQALDD